MRFLLFSEVIKTHDGGDFAHIVSFHQGAHTDIIDEDGSQIGVVEHITDILIAQSVVDRHSRHSIKQAGEVNNAPLRSVPRK